MKVDKLAGTRSHSGEPPRSTAYYYADLERFKKKPQEDVKDQNELSEYVESNEVVNDGAIREVPPLRDRQWSLPEYHTPEARKETYSTAGTFPMPEKEKEPLLAELEVVGRLPLTQLDSSPGVRRSRSWYLCCPNMGEEEISRESSWRYSSLRPITAPPAPGQNGFSQMVISQSSNRDDIVSLRAERDALARALAAERQRAASAARAHDARLAELHGVIAELVRRRAADKQSRAIPEEEVSDECESTTQPAGELDNDADHSRTEQNDTLSPLSPAELPTPQEPKVDHELPEDTDTSTHEVEARTPQPRVEVSPRGSDTSLNLSERDSELLSNSRCWQEGREESGGSCERERGSPAAMYTPPPVVVPPSGERQPKMAARVRLRRTEDADDNIMSDHAWCLKAAEQLSLDVCAQADLREALASDHADSCPCLARWLASEARLVVSLGCVSRASELSRRLHVACAQLEAAAGALCAALTAADRALEAYDVLLALAETSGDREGPNRCAAERVAWQVLRRLRAAPAPAAPLSPGPWLHHRQEEPFIPCEPWTEEQEAQLRAHAATLKATTVTLRGQAAQPTLFCYHDIDEEEIPKTTGVFSMADMEAAVVMEEMLSARAASLSARSRSRRSHEHDHKSESSRTRRRRERQWREAHASETDL